VSDAVSDTASDGARDELVADRRRERALLWKGLLALLVVVALVLARQQWWV
jgi:predicted nucleic acid-binding Zn ribbon protein